MPEINRRIKLPSPLILAFAPLLIALAVYLTTLNKYILLGDTGEFVAASFEAGIPHPPGYPLFTLLGYVLSKIPLGNFVQRVGFVSVLFGAASIGLLSLFLFRVTSSKIASYAGALALGFSSIFWLYSANAEIITLNTFFLILLLLLAFLYFETKKQVFLYTLPFVFGLSLANHYTVLSIIPALALLLLPKIKEFLHPKKAFISVVLFILGLTPYIYLPLAAGKLPYVNWDNPSTLEGLISLITRKDYGYIVVGSYFRGDLGDILTRQLPFYFTNTLNSFGPIAASLFFLGLLPVRRNKIYFALLISLFFSGPLLVAYSNFSIDSPFPDVAINQRRTMQTVYVISTPFIASFIALGIANLETFLKRYKVVQSKELVILIGISVFVFPLILNYQAIKKADNATFDFYGRSVLTSLPENSLLIVGADNTYIFWYLQAVENLRKDVPVINFSLMQGKWYVEQLKERYPEVDFPFDAVVIRQNTDNFYQQNLKKYKIFFSPLDDQSRASISPTLKLIPDGLGVHLLLQDEELDIEDYKRKQDKFWGELQERPYLFQDYKDLPTREILMAYARAWTNIGIIYENYKKEDWTIEAYERARLLSSEYYLATEKLANIYLKEGMVSYSKVIPLYREILNYNPSHPISLRNLGLIYAELGRYSEAKKFLEKYIRLETDPSSKQYIQEIYDQIKFLN